jgi:hypothetical protein
MPKIFSTLVLPRFTYFIGLALPLLQEQSYGITNYISLYL